MQPKTAILLINRALAASKLGNAEKCQVVKKFFRGVNSILFIVGLGYTIFDFGHGHRFNICSFEPRDKNCHRLMDLRHDNDRD